MRETWIRQIFETYVTEKQDREYHSQDSIEAENELEVVMDEHVKNLEGWTEISVKAMCLANEYERDGFVAGFQMAMQMCSVLRKEVCSYDH